MLRRTVPWALEGRGEFEDRVLLLRAMGMEWISLASRRGGVRTAFAWAEGAGWDCESSGWVAATAGSLISGPAGSSGQQLEMHWLEAAVVEEHYSARRR